MSTWNELRDRLAGKGRQKLPYYDRVVRMFYDAGFQLATPAMAEAYARLQQRVVGDHDRDYPYTAFQHLTEQLPSYCEFAPFADSDLVGYVTHDRSERVEEAVEQCANHFQEAIGASQAWLLPPDDDKEYISWTLIFAVGGEQQVLEQIGLAQQAINAVPDQDLVG